MSDRQRAIELILANRIFATLTPADAGALYKAGAVAALPGGSPLFAEGDPSDGFYLVLRGRFAVIRGGERIAGVSHERKHDWIGSRCGSDEIRGPGPGRFRKSGINSWGEGESRQRQCRQRRISRGRFQCVVAV